MSIAVSALTNIKGNASGDGCVAAVLSKQPKPPHNTQTRNPALQYPLAHPGTVSPIQHFDSAPVLSLGQAVALHSGNSVATSPNGFIWKHICPSSACL